MFKRETFNDPYDQLWHDVIRRTKIIITTIVVVTVVAVVGCYTNKKLNEWP